MQCGGARSPSLPQVYGRKVEGGPPYAVGVAHFSQPAEAVADFLFQPSNMHKWNDELCEKGEARARRCDCASPSPLQALSRCAAPRARFEGARRTHPPPLLPAAQLLRQLNPDAALGHLIYYGETALGITVVSTRVRPAHIPPLFFRCSPPSCAQNLTILSVRERREGGVILIGSASVDDSLGPAPPKGTVRARLLSGGGVIKPSADGGCDVMFMTQVDFGGALASRVAVLGGRGLTRPCPSRQAAPVYRHHGVQDLAALARGGQEAAGCRKMSAGAGLPLRTPPERIVQRCLMFIDALITGRRRSRARSARDSPLATNLSRRLRPASHDAGSGARAALRARTFCRETAVRTVLVILCAPQKSAARVSAG